jgi:rod shape-determining protein MreC
MHLNTENANLTKRIAELETETYAYRKIIEQMSDSVQTAVMEIDSIHTLIYQFVPAKIVYNSVSRLDNYMTLNKGSNDGIEPDMGVISENGKGVVGVILKTSAHYSIVIPILNPKFRLNCKLKNNNYGGPLLWDGNDSRYTYLTGLARHVDFEIGDTIVTSGNSIIFPEGIPVGSIVDSQKQKNDNYNSLKIKLFTNLSTTTNVIIVSNKYQKEQKKLQELIDN